MKRNSNEFPKISLQIWVIGFILVVAAILRFAGISYGLPYTVRPDEPTMVTIAQRIFKTGDFNPHWFGYPSLMFYTNALVYAIFFGLGRLAGMFTSPADLTYPEIITTGVGHSVLPMIFLLSRGLSALLGTLSVLFVWLIGRRLQLGSLATFFASAALAVSPAAVQSSQSITPDVFALFALLLSFLGTAGILVDGKIRDYLLAGIGAGLAISGKYNAAIIILPLVVAHFLHLGRNGFYKRELYFGGLACGIAFVLTTPYAILDWRAFLSGSTIGATQYIVEGHAGQEGNTLSWYIWYLANIEGYSVFLACLQLVLAFFYRSKPTFVLLVFPVIYFLLVSQLIIRNERTIMLIIPFIGLLAGMALRGLYDFAQKRVPRVLNILLVSGISFLLLSTPAQAAIAADVRLNQTDARDLAREWLDKNLAPSSRVVAEPYTAYLDTKRFVVQGVPALIDHSPEWYVQNGFEYLLASREIFAPQLDRYAPLFSRFDLFQQFVNNGSEIRVYKTNALLPSHRVAARFGNDGELIELVGYDSDSTQVVPGKSFTLNLWWRPVTESREPLELELRLLDQNNHEIAIARGDLFQGKGWRDGMFQAMWTFPVPSDTPPQVYRVDASVIQARFSYRVPAMTWTGDTIDLLSLGPF